MEIQYEFDSLIESKKYSELSNSELKSKKNELQYYLSADGNATLYMSIAKKKIQDAVSKSSGITIVNSSAEDNKLKFTLEEGNIFEFNLLMDTFDIEFPQCVITERNAIVLGKILSDIDTLKKLVKQYQFFKKSANEYKKLYELINMLYVESLDVNNYKVGDTYKRDGVVITITKVSDKTISFDHKKDGVIRKRRLKHNAFNKFFITNVA